MQKSSCLFYHNILLDKEFGIKCSEKVAAKFLLNMCLVSLIQEVFHIYLKMLLLIYFSLYLVIIDFHRLVLSPGTRSHQENKS